MVIDISNQCHSASGLSNIVMSDVEPGNVDVRLLWRLQLTGLIVDDMICHFGIELHHLYTQIYTQAISIKTLIL